MTAATTSAQYSVWRVFTARMKALPFTLADGVDDLPSVWFGDPAQPNPDEDGNPPAAIERLVVVATVDTPQVDWDAIGNFARMEVWRFPIFVETAIPGMTSDEASLRLEELTSLIEANVHSIQAGARTGVDQPAEWFQYPLWSVAIERVRSMCPVGPAGYIGRSEVVIGCKFRINTPPRTE